MAQRLRYKVFYEEMSAIADAQTLATVGTRTPMTVSAITFLWSIIR